MHFQLNLFKIDLSWTIITTMNFDDTYYQPHGEHQGKRASGLMRTRIPCENEEEHMILVLDPAVGSHLVKSNSQLDTGTGHLVTRTKCLDSQVPKTRGWTLFRVRANMCVWNTAFSFTPSTVCGKMSTSSAYRRDKLHWC